MEIWDVNKMNVRRVILDVGKSLARPTFVELLNAIDTVPGWAYLLSAVTVPTIEAEAVVQYAANYIPNLYTAQTTILGTANVLTGFGIAFAAALMVGFFFINFVGIKFLGQFNKYITIWKVVIPTLTFLILFTIFKCLPESQE